MAARVTEFTVSIGRTVNLGNYHSLRMEYSVTMEVDEGDEKVREAMRGAMLGAKQELERAIVHELEAMELGQDVIFASLPKERR